MEQVDFGSLYDYLCCRVVCAAFAKCRRDAAQSIQKSKLILPYYLCIVPISEKS